uniref:Uncharacterized protein n=1 Tax=Schistosoma haematobium TaxID=6185 RepID=A0A094ZJ91_SCHHA
MSYLVKGAANNRMVTSGLQLKKHSQNVSSAINLFEPYPIPNCFAEPGDVHDYYMKEIEKYSHLRSLEDKENEEASLALAAQLLFEDGLNSPADDILPFECQNNNHHIENNLTPIASSSSRSKGIKKKCGRKQNKKATKTSKTLLDYAINTANVGLKPEVANEQVHLNFVSLEF